MNKLKEGVLVAADKTVAWLDKQYETQERQLTTLPTTRGEKIILRVEQGIEMTASMGVGILASMVGPRPTNIY